MIAIVCDECGSNYKVKDQHAGKRFRCKECETIIRVPGGAGSSSPTSPARRRKKAKRQQPVADEYEDYGTDDYGEDYGTDDYGTDSYDDYGSYDDDQGSYDDDYGDYQPTRKRSSSGSSSRKRSSRSSRKKKRSSSGGGFTMDIFCDWRVFVGVPLANTLLVGLLSFIPAVGGIFAMVSLFACMGLMAVGSIMSIVVAFQEDVACGLMYLFVPLYPLYYTITRWEEARGPFMMQIVGGVALFGPLFAALIVIGVDAGLNAPGVGQ